MLVSSTREVLMAFCAIGVADTPKRCARHVRAPYAQTSPVKTAPQHAGSGHTILRLRYRAGWLARALNSPRAAAMLPTPTFLTRSLQQSTAVKAALQQYLCNCTHV